VFIPEGGSLLIVSREIGMETFEWNTHCYNAYPSGWSRMFVTNDWELFLRPQAKQSSFLVLILKWVEKAVEGSESKTNNGITPANICAKFWTPRGEGSVDNSFTYIWILKQVYLSLSGPPIIRFSFFILLALIEILLLYTSNSWI
jgi:hypothetical protein